MARSLLLGGGGSGIGLAPAVHQRRVMLRACAAGVAVVGLLALAVALGGSRDTLHASAGEVMR